MKLCEPDEFVIGMVNAIRNNSALNGSFLPAETDMTFQIITDKFGGHTSYATVDTFVEAVRTYMLGNTMTGAPPQPPTDEDEVTSSAGVSSASSKRERELEDENDELRKQIRTLTGDTSFGEDAAPGGASGSVLTPQ